MIETGVPKFSVVIPAYNHEKYVGFAVQSVLEQTFEDFELIIVNDGSTDDTLATVSKFDDPRIRVYSHENQGAHATINRGVDLARGSYIAVLNSDDIYLPTRLERAFDVLSAQPSVMGVFSHVEFINAKGESTGFQRGVENDLAEQYPVVVQLLSGNFLLSTSNLIVRKDAFATIGLFRSLKYSHDYDFFLKLAYHFDVEVLTDSLLQYRVHAENTLNKYKSAEIDLEVGAVLCDFLLNHDIGDRFPGDDVHRNMADLFDFLKAYRTERMMLIVYMFVMCGGADRKTVFSDLINGDANPFKKTCLQFLEGRADWWWQEQARAWEIEAGEWKQQVEDQLAEIRRLNDVITDVKLGADYLEGLRQAWQDTAEELKRGNEYLQKQIQSPRVIVKLGQWAYPSSLQSLIRPVSKTNSGIGDSSDE
ncbi:MAG: glycosyltransferase [Desulfuromusa sp.]|nr:glycosyltransferase [Desulfuromusa sp.]